ncbi:MAG: transcription antitermination factor NusB [bacterium]|nr:transcription antitermination factor NusB [bacterium]
MGKRNTGRKLAMQALYQSLVRKESIESIIQNFLSESNYMEDTRNWAIALARDVNNNKDELDALISKYSIDWDINRINPIDLSILKIAFFELLYTDTQSSVVINEAIEIARKYSTDEAPKFVNGILGNYLVNLKKEQK